MEQELENMQGNIFPFNTWKSWMVDTENCTCATDWPWAVGCVLHIRAFEQSSHDMIAIELKSILLFCFSCGRTLEI